MPRKSQEISVHDIKNGIKIYFDKLEVESDRIIFKDGDRSYFMKGVLYTAYKNWAVESQRAAKVTVEFAEVDGVPKAAFTADDLDERTKNNVLIDLGIADKLYDELVDNISNREYEYPPRKFLLHHSHELKPLVRKIEAKREKGGLDAILGDNEYTRYILHLDMMYKKYIEKGD